MRVMNIEVKTAAINVQERSSPILLMPASSSCGWSLYYCIITEKVKLSACKFCSPTFRQSIPWCCPQAKKSYSVDWRTIMVIIRCAMTQTMASTGHVSRSGHICIVEGRLHYSIFGLFETALGWCHPSGLHLYAKTACTVTSFHDQQAHYRKVS